MSRIDDLIRAHCPGGVKFHKLGEVAKVRRGVQLLEAERVPGPFPVVTASRTSGLTHNQSNFASGAITVTSHGAHAGHVNLWESPIWLANNVFLFEPDDQCVLGSFLYFALKNSEGRLHRTSQGGGVPYINARDLEGLTFQIPPLEVQREIVRVLDLFQSLEAELEAELEARRRQYAHYRDSLLDFTERGGSGG